MGHKLNPLADLSGEQVDFPGLPAAQDDASQVSGQDPQSLFGIPVSYQSGAPGTVGITPDQAPAGGRPVMVSNPNNYQGTAGGGSGTQFITVTDAVSGPDDWTAPSPYPPANQIVPGDYYPVPGGPGNNAGRGRVLRGGFMKGQRG